MLKKLIQKKFTYVGFSLLAILFSILFSSYSGGINGVSTVGCTCHGPSTSTTSLQLFGLPLTGWIPGNTYSLSLTVTNFDSTLVNAGFDLSVDEGSFSGNPAFTTLTSNNKEIHHTAPQSLINGTAVWTFNWTAPTNAASSLVIFKLASNCGNGNFQFSGDKWSMATFTTIKATTVGLNEENELTNTVNIFPNPCKDQLNINFTDQPFTGNILVLDMYGRNVLNSYVKQSKQAIIDLSALAAGVYMICGENRAFMTKIYRN